MSLPPEESEAEADVELTPEEIEGLRAALGEIDRGETFALEDVMDELREELAALEQVRNRRAG
ncbi:MAG TPA: hypothetical protein VNO21_01140 [Polyangiaceae bacterium]|nr:hypothetical protein [Polyangiaceae bacterium]